MRNPYSPAAPGWWWVTCPPTSGGGTMIGSPGWQVAMNAYRLAIDPLAPRCSTKVAPNTWAASSAAQVSTNR